MITRRELRLQREAAERAERERADAARYQGAPDADRSPAPAADRSPASDASAASRRRTGMPSTGRPGYGEHRASAPVDTPTSADLRGFHLLLLDDAVEISDALALIHNKLPDLNPTLDEHAQMRLSRHSRLSSGTVLDPADAAALEVPDWAHHAIVVDCPRDRQPTPPPDWFADADGLNEAFPDGMPDREEERILSLMLAIASRLHTGVRLADEPGLPTRVIIPDPEAKVDLYLYSPYWLEPQVALELVRRHAPHAFQQSLPTPDEDVLAQASIDDPLFDASAPVILDGYALLVPLGDIDESAGSLEIRVMEAEWLPPIVAAHTDSPQIEYHVHWMDTESQRYRPNPRRRFRRMRAEVARLTDAIGAEILVGSDGVGVDENGFLVTSRQLRG
ncbi:hypothetical protein [Brevibacterium spongiae]|uniref:Uncharacterized protein n=1 Tax=Brevibacterium spongiae TaxID=2909672 RepID=A0ABY5SMZ9_9MICO|nr:hypothetical protein [Brevibacterium spongiae]UVI35893.1 hypothetical protein L1F31_17540 [Brevibacterium spongiae]